MFGMLGLILPLVFVALLALAIAFILDVMMPRTSWKIRPVWAAVIAAFLPTSLPIIIVLSEGGFGTETTITVAALVIGAIFLAAVVCFPVAYFFSKRRAAGRPALDAAKDFD